MPNWRFRGYVEHAASVLRDAESRKPRHFEASERTFLEEGFKDAADRMTALATAVGTAGSFVLVLVALLVSFASQTDVQSDKLLGASNTEARLALGCSDKDSTLPCDAAKLEQAHADVEHARSRLDTLGALNRYQAITGALVVLAFLLGLAALLTNPVPGLHAGETDAAGHRIEAGGARAAEHRDRRSAVELAHDERRMRFQDHSESSEPGAPALRVGQLQRDAAA